ncbi:MAG: RnfH family protein [Burkholderiaceae bacterium]
MARTESTQRIRVSVAMAGPIESGVVEVELDAGATLAEAALASGLLPPGAPLDLGVWGHRRAPVTALREGDRVEIYRVLTVDPMAARRIRAEVKRRRAE